MTFVKSQPEIEKILEGRREVLGKDYPALWGHAYRMFNYCLALSEKDPETESKVAIAAAFHDIGIWTHDTFDYLEPSAQLAVDYLKSTGRASWSDEVSAMVHFHHKVTPYREPDGGLIEAFRKADLVDLSLGLVHFGLHRDDLRASKQIFPNAGFHWRVTQFSLRWALRHPLNPLPMFKR